MTTHQYGGQVTVLTPNMASRKRSHADMKNSTLPSKWIDDEVYRQTILQLPSTTSEDEVEDNLVREARELGVLPPQIARNVEAITSSLSATTIASDPTNQSSIASQSTAPTSRASSDHRPGTSFSSKSLHTPSASVVPSILSDIEKKRHSGFRSGIRKMANFRKRKSLALDSPTSRSIDGDCSTKTGDESSMKSGMKSPVSIKSGKSYFSNSLSTTKTSYEPEPPVDQEALQRSMNCREILNLQSQQLDEKLRFMTYQSSIVSQLQKQHDSVRSQKAEAQRKLVVEQSEKNDKAIEDLESRQLDQELRILKEHDLEKRAVLTRLRHMEAYCQNPTPPPTPIDSTSGRPSVDSTHPLPERKVTDRDYHNLAQQYRERDVMDSLHAAKINVLRGKQKKAVENYILKKEREIEQLEKSQRKELDDFDADLRRQAAELRQAFQGKRAKTETRWRLQALIVKTKMERRTGLKFESLPDVTAVEVDDQV